MMDASTALGRPGRDLWTARLVALLLVACAWLVPGLARADPQDLRCIVAETLRGLTLFERQRITDTCTHRSAPDPTLAPQLASLAARSQWEAAALGDLFADSAPLLDLGADASVVQRLRSVRAALGRPLRGKGCKELQRALDGYFAARDAGQRPTPPFAADTLAGCIPVDAAELADLAFLAIPVESTASLFVAASAGDRLTLQWFTPADAYVHTIAACAREPCERRVFVVAVPRWSVVTARALAVDPARPSASARAAPQRLWKDVVPRDQTVWDQAPPVGCLRLSVELDPDTTLLLDGQPLTSGEPLRTRRVDVSHGPHELLALRCGDGYCAIRYREVLPASAATATRNQCLDVERDFQFRRSVAILQVRAAPGCDVALASRAGQLAADYLRRSEAATGRVFRDLAAYASITAAVTSLRHGLNPTVGAAVGADTGADSLDLIAGVAKEAWRQGIDELVNLELRCSGDAGLALHATGISAREVFGESTDRVAGLDLTDMLRVETHRFTGEQQLATAVASVLDQLFGRSYIRFYDGPRRVPYRSPARVDLIASGGREYGSELELVARHAWGVRPDCHALHGEDRARAVAGMARLGLSDSVPVQLGGGGVDDPLGAARAAPVSAEQPIDVGWRRGSGAPISVTASIPPSRHGTTIVTAHWSRNGKLGPPVDATCIHFDVPDREVWATVMYAPDVLLRAPNADYAARHLRVMAGFTRYPLTPWLGFGLAAGYTYTRYSASAGLPSWQDLSVDPAASHAPLAWGRHGVVLGPLLEFRSRRVGVPVTRRSGDRAVVGLPVEFRARLSLGVGVGVVDIRDIAGFADFVGSREFGTARLRLRPTVDATGEFGVSYNAGPLTIGHFITIGATALNDMASSARAVSATSGAGLYAGVGLLLGASRR